MAFPVVISVLLMLLSVSGAKNDQQRPEETLLALLTHSLSLGANLDDCQRHSQIFRDALSTYEPWALQMYDSSAKIPAGVITGNYKQLGNYDECLRVQSAHGFVGKACSVSVSFNMSNGENHEDPDLVDLLKNVAVASGMGTWTSPSKISVPYEWLWCVPSSCGAKTISEAVKMALSPLKRPGRVDISISMADDACHTAETDAAVLELADWLYIWLLTGFAAIIVACTTYDLVQSSVTERPDCKGTRHLLFTSFSLYTNGRRLMTTRQTTQTIRCLDALRFLSICWIIYGHTTYLEAVGVQLDLSGLNKMHQSWASLLILNGNIVTDTFFLLGGLLLTYSELNRKEKDQHGYRLNAALLYLHRYTRLTPAYAIVIGFYATLFPKIGSGPHWANWVGTNSNFCVANWWTNLLYVNNYVNVPQMCISQSWYISVDMQLVWIAPIFLYPIMLLGASHCVSIIVLVAGLIASILAPLLITYFEGLTGTMLYYNGGSEVIANVYLHIYTRVYTRTGPYIVGLILGCILHKVRKNSIKFAKIYVALGWIFTLFLSFSVIFGPRAMYSTDYEYNSIEAAFYAGFHRTVFAVCIAWIILATVLGHAGPVGTLLSWPGWMPLGRLTYSAYLTHYIVLLYNAGSVRTAGSLSTFGLVKSFFGNLSITMFLSVVLCLCFELPFAQLWRLMYLRPSRGFGGTSYRPKMHALSGESTAEIYRSLGDVSATSGSFDNVFSQSPATSIEIISNANIQRPAVESKPEGTTSRRF